MNKKGLSRVQFILMITVFLILIVIGILVIDFYRAKTRDAIRIADMAILQSAMNRLYSDQATYVLNSECKVGNIIGDKQCSTALSSYINLSTALVDPLGSSELCTQENCSNNKACAYTIGQEFNDKEYSIYFNLEKGISGLTSGCHLLTQNGIE